MAEAESLLLQAREKDPDNPQAAVFLGHLIDNHPEMQEAWIELIQVLRQDQRQKDAENAARQCLQRIPGSPACREALASLLLQSGSYSESVGLYQKLVSTAQQSKSILDGLGFARTKLGNYREAEKCFQKSSALENSSKTLGGTGRKMFTTRNKPTPVRIPAGAPRTTANHTTGFTGRKARARRGSSR